MNSNFILCALMAVVGLVMIVAAEPLITVLIIIIGVYALIDGVFGLTTLLPLMEDKRFRIDVIIRSAISIIVGLLCIILPIAVAKFAWQTMAYILAIYLLVSAALEIAAVVRLHATEIEVKKFVIEIITSIVIAIILFMLPSDFGFTIIKIGGALVVIAAIVLAIYTWKHKDIIEEVVSEDDDTK